MTIRVASLGHVSFAASSSLGTFSRAIAIEANTAPFPNQAAIFGGEPIGIQTRLDGRFIAAEFVRSALSTFPVDALCDLATCDAFEPLAIDTTFDVQSIRATISGGADAFTMIADARLIHARLEAPLKIGSAPLEAIRRFITFKRIWHAIDTSIRRALNGAFSLRFPSSVDLTNLEQFAGALFRARGRTSIRRILIDIQYVVTAEDDDSTAQEDCGDWHFVVQRLAHQNFPSIPIPDKPIRASRLNSEGPFWPTFLRVGVMIHASEPPTTPAAPRTKAVVEVDARLPI